MNISCTRRRLRKELEGNRPLGKWGLGAAGVVAVATVLSRAVLIPNLHPSLYSVEGMETLDLAIGVLGAADPWRWLWGIITNPEALSDLQYTQYAGGSLVMNFVALPFAVVFGPNAVSLYISAAVWAALGAGVWTAAAWRAGGPRAALLLALAYIAAPPYLVFRQVTALGNHCELIPLLGAAVFLLQARKGAWRGLWLGLLAGLGTYFDWPFAVFVMAALPVWLQSRPNGREFALAVLGAALGLAPMLLLWRTDSPAPWEFAGSNLFGHVGSLAGLEFHTLIESIWRVPALSPMTDWTQLEPLVRAPLLVGLILALWRGQEARACALFVLGYTAAMAATGVGGVHRETPLVIPLLFCSAVVYGRLAWLCVPGVVLSALASAWDAQVFHCPQNIPTASTADSALYYQQRLGFYTPATIPAINTMLTRGPELLTESWGLGLFFVMSPTSNGVYYWRFIDAFSPDGVLDKDACFSEPDASVPTPVEIARYLPPDLPGEVAMGAGWSLAARSLGDGQVITEALLVAPAELQSPLAVGLGMGATCGAITMTWEPTPALALAYEDGLSRCTLVSRPRSDTSEQQERDR